MYIHVGNGPGETEFLVEVTNDFELRALMGLGGGIRLQAAAVATDNFGYSGPGGVDRFQAAFEPYFVYEPVGRKGFFIRAGALIAADNPLGFGFKRDGLATFTVSGGGKF